ncbi:hypothetical protein K3495_g6853 [Podosphaera aphanis]|nr:hypothetical protein K3495_g6853 [Podosphaera aphanis]
MDSPYSALQEDVYHIQMDVKHVQAVQLSHADRLSKLEKRQADDAALKSVWGAGSPFPGVMSGTLQPEPIKNIPKKIFDDFDIESEQNILENLILESEEPVRFGTSRSNNVRFDVSASQSSNWVANAPNSGDIASNRPCSGIGSHPMTERSFSRKSDGRHSSAGHSIHSVHSLPSGRTSSLGLDTNFAASDQDVDSSFETIPHPFPGIFILGTVPSIIRCWLNTKFSHDTLLYAAVCSGSQRSVLQYALVKELGLQDMMQKDANGRHTIRLSVFLPEAIINQALSRSASPTPQLPSLTTNFEITGVNQNSSFDRKKEVRVFIGSDTLRTRCADILFSQNLMTIFGDDGNKLSVPFVRPEDQNSFKNLYTVSLPPERNELKATAPSFRPTDSTSQRVTPPSKPTNDVHRVSMTSGKSEDQPAALIGPTSPILQSPSAHLKSLNQGLLSKIPSEIQSGLKSSYIEGLPTDVNPPDNATPQIARRENTSTIWGGSWRNGGSSGPDSEPTSGYQRATRGGGRSMKILKSSSKSTSTNLTFSTSGARSFSDVASPYEPLLLTRAPSEPRNKNKVLAGGGDHGSLRWEKKTSTSDDQRSKNTISVLRGPNPIGEASAFAWMDSGKPKVTTSTTVE